MSRLHTHSVILLITLFVLISLFPSPASAQVSDTDAYVTRSGTKFFLNGKEFRFVGFNLFDAAATSFYKCTWWPRFTDSELDATLKYMRQQSGATVLRFWAFQRYTRSGAGRDWSGIDRVIRIAKSNGFKVLPVLENGPGACTGDKTMEKWQYKGDTWYVSGYKVPFGNDALSYRDYVRDIVTRYKNEPTILGWSMMNDANTGKRNASGKTVIVDFAKDIAGLIKSIDSKHLVTVGTQSNGATGGSGKDFVDVYSLSQIDFTTATERAYWKGQENDPLPGSSDGKTLPGVTSPDCLKTYQSKVACSLANAMQVVKKPFVLVDAGIKVDNKPGSRAQRATVMGNKMKAMFTNGASGYLLWHWNKLIDSEKYDIIQSQNDPLMATMKTYAGYLPNIANPSSPGKAPAPLTDGSNTMVERGVNLFGGWQAVYGNASTFATGAQLSYFKSKGLNTFRVGFHWDHLQYELMGPLNTNYLAKMDKLVSEARARGQKIAFVPLPGTWKGNVVGSAAVPQAAFNDLWVKLAMHYKNEPAIWGYNLINEPNMGDVWNITIAPSVIAAIRTVDMKKPIIVPTSTGGYGHYFNYHLIGLPMQDPANNLIYEAHFYFDTPADGVYPRGFDVANANLNIGVDRAKDFVNWCVSNNQKCYAGEYGIPAGWKSGTATCISLGGSNKDPRWLTILDNFLTYLDQNNISGTYWNGGPYGDVNSIGPYCDSQGKFIDAPQMPILLKHLGRTVAPMASFADMAMMSPETSCGIERVFTFDPETPGMTITPPCGTISAGGQAMYTLALNAPPISDVTVSISTMTDGITITPSSLVFTPDNWNVMQTVVIGLDANTAVTTPEIVISNDVLSTGDADYDVLETVDYVLMLTSDVIPVDAEVDSTEDTQAGTDTSESVGENELLRLTGVSVVSDGEIGLAQSGEIATWTFTLENVSGADLSDVSVLIRYSDDDLEGVRAVSSRGINGTFHKGSLLAEYILGTLSANQMVTLTLDIRLPEHGGVFTGMLSAAVNGVTQAMQASLSVLSVSSLPATGETPWWRPLILLVILASLSSVVLAYGRNRLRSVC